MPQPEDKAAPRLFISYSHDSAAHEDQVLALADRLRHDGIDALIDQYDTAPPDGWPMWMDREIQKADFVAMVCTEIYLRRVEDRESAAKGRGVLWEAKLIYNSLYLEDSKAQKFIPVLFAGGQVSHIPRPIRGSTYYQVDSAEGSENFYRHLTGQPRHGKPTLGKLKALPAIAPQSHPASPEVSIERVAEADAKIDALVPVAQFDPATLLLETLRSASEAPTLLETPTASQVNGIGKSLGLNDTQLLRILARLSESGDVELQWGGNVKVIRPKPTGHSIHLEQGATFVQNSRIGGDAAVGSNAMAAGAVRGSGPAQLDQLEAIAKLTAAITLMRDSLLHLEGETRRQVENAVEEARGILPALRTDKPDEGDLTPRLKKAADVLGILGNVTTIATGTLPGLPQAINLMHQGLAAAFKLLGGS